MNLVSRFVQVGFPRDANFSDLCISPRWGDDELRLRRLPSVSDNSSSSKNITSTSPAPRLDTRPEPTVTDCPKESPHATVTGLPEAKNLPCIDTGDAINITGSSLGQCVLKPRTPYVSATTSFADVGGIVLEEPENEPPGSPLVVPRTPEICTSPNGISSQRMRESMQTFAARRQSVVSLTNLHASSSSTNVVVKKTPHPIEFTYRPCIIDQYPLQELNQEKRSKDDLYTEQIAMFCFPDDMRIIESSPSPPISTSHSFVLTKEDGVKSYCVCLSFWEKPTGTLASVLRYRCQLWQKRNINPSDIEYLQHLRRQIEEQRTIVARGESQAEPGEVAIAQDKLRLYSELLLPFSSSASVDPEHLWMPRAICLISPWPIYDVMNDYLVGLYVGLTDKSGSRTSLESCLVNIFHEIPVLPLGRIEVVIHSALGDNPVYFHRPSQNQSSIIKNLSFYPLFRSLSHQQIVFLFECILNERKIIFTSSHAGMLNHCIQSLIILLFPFDWFHVLIPIVPVGLLYHLEAPVPYIAGILKEHFPMCRQILEDVVVCDLDNKVLSNWSLAPIVSLPARQKAKLLARLHKANKTRADGPPWYIAETFPLGRIYARSKSVLGEDATRNQEVQHSTMNVRSPSSTSGSSASSLNLRRQSGTNQNVLSASGILNVGAHSATGSSHLRCSDHLIPQSPTLQRGSVAQIPSTSASVDRGSLSYSVATNSNNNNNSNSIYTKIGFISPNGPPPIISEGHIFNRVAGLQRSSTIISATLASGTTASESRGSSWRCEVCQGWLHGGQTMQCSGCGLHVHHECLPQIVENCRKAFNEADIQDAFLKFFVSVFRNYRSHLVGGEFRDQKFLAGETEKKAFLTEFLKTQAFLQFLRDRTGLDVATSDSDVLYFDELIKQKNRQSLFRRKQGNGYLNDLSLRVSTRFECVQPVESGSVLFSYGFPIISVAAVSEHQIRVPPSLVTTHEEILMAMFSARVARVAKSQAKSRSGDWFRRAAAQFAYSVKSSGPAVAGASRRGTTVGGGEAGALEAISSPEEMRAYVEKRVTVAWDTLRNPRLSGSLGSPQDHGDRTHVLQGLKVEQDELAAVCEACDLDEIRLIQKQIDMIQSRLDEQYRELFLGSASRAGFCEPPPVIMVQIPNGGLDEGT